MLTRQIVGAFAQTNRRGSLASGLVVSLLAGAIFSGPARAGIVTTLVDPQDRGSFTLGVSVVGSGVATSGDPAQTKIANDYAMMYSTNYAMTVNYVINYSVNAQGMATFDNGTIRFSGGGFSTEQIALIDVTGDFMKNMFTKYSFSSLNWYPNLPERSYAQNGLTGNIDVSGKKPVVNINASYLWKQTKVQPAATLTYVTTFNANPGPGSPFDPVPPGPAGIPEPAAVVLATTILGSVFCSSMLKKAWGRVAKAKAAD